MTSMSAIVGSVTTVATGFASTVAQWVEVIEEQPLILFFVLVPFIGAGIGFLKRLIQL